MIRPTLPHDSAVTHVQGRSEYVDDRPVLANELHVGVVYSPHARARIRRIDPLKALALPGVAGVFVAADFHHNRWGSIFPDQPLLAENEVAFVGEAVALVAAESPEVLKRALREVRVSYEVLPAILSIAEARKVKAFIGSERKIEKGDVERALREAPHRLEGEVEIQGADHFYLENQASVAYPKEDGQIEVHSSTQHPTETQHVVAHALGLAAKDVVCVVKRMGGAFGGKESQAAPFAAYAALVANRTGRAARVVLNKDDDMIMTGKRNPFHNHYRVGFDEEGRILALDAELYSDGGAYADLSTAIMERALLHIDNAYFLPNVRVLGQVCRTNVHPHTAFRGFGGPKGVATIERILEEIAHKLGLDPLDVRKRNCYAEGRNVTPYGQKLANNLLPQLFEQLERSCDYRERRREIRAHNERASAGEEEWRRGLSLTAVKFGISFTTRFLNQGNALVIVHRDGSLQVSTGATEMGQGVNARIAEIVAADLGLPRDHVRMMPTTTDKNANTSPTAASSGTDINGTAALMAAQKLRARLGALAAQLFDLPEAQWAKNCAGLGTVSEIVPAELPEGDVEFVDGYVRDARDPKRRISFPDLVNEAYLNRISLSEYAHYRVPKLAFNKLTGQGEAFFYFTQGVAASEVKVHRHTGEVKVERVDILMDLGRPVNEALDQGQVLGGFVQGMGWVTTENLFYSAEGKLLSHSPSTYKIPNVQDTPRIFRSELIDNGGNSENVRGTKAVGEPPLLLCLSVWTAIHDALKDLPHHCERYPSLVIPATQERVLRAMDPAAFAAWEPA